MFIERKRQFRYVAATSVGVGVGLCALLVRNFGPAVDTGEEIHRASTRLGRYFSKTLTRWCVKYSRTKLFHRAGVPKLLIRLSNSKVEYLHNVGVRALAVVWFDSNATVERLKSRCEPHTLVSLARTPGAHPAWFALKGLQQDSNSTEASDELEEEVIHLLKRLYSKTSDTCVLWMIEEALKSQSDETTLEPQDGGVFWCFGEDTLLKDEPRKLTSEERWISYLNCLKHATNCFQDCDTLLRDNVLGILEHTVKDFNGSKIVLALCGDVIANLSVIKDAHKLIMHAGFTEISKYLADSPYSSVSSAGQRALHNLDTFDNFQYSLLDGVHQVYPTAKTEPSNFEVDIVFVHGLSGGPFVTWRQKENSSSLYNNRETNCWPKDWLARDIPHARMLCVEYSTHLTNWIVTCPYTDETHSLTARGKELSDKLLQAGVGNRPTIWITHSMGGLIVKDILAKQPLKGKENPLLQNTYGVVFYSVPHRGSPLASQVSHAKFITFPSVEVSDLQEDSFKLKELHDNFMKLVHDRGIKILSFFEEQPLEVPVMKVKVKIVPSWSAQMGVGKEFEIDENHVYVCKPESKDDTSYKELLNFVELLILEHRKTEAVYHKTRLSC